MQFEPKIVSLVSEGKIIVLHILLNCCRYTSTIHTHLLSIHIYYTILYYTILYYTILYYTILYYIISLIPRLSHRLLYLTFRTISWSWNSSTNYFMARAFLRVRFHNTHESYVCRAKCRVCGTVKSKLGQWIRINIGRARLKRNLDLISVFHCHCPRAQLLAAHTAAHQS